MVPLEKDYTFQSTNGSVTLKDLFGTKSQLIVYHFMFAPTDAEGCRGCSFMASSFPDVRHLAAKDTAFVVISRAPIEKITAFKEKNGWKFPWVSSYESDFNYDFHVSLDEKIAPIEYGFMNKAELDASGQKYPVSGEQPGLNVFKLEKEQVYHTYTASAMEKLLATFSFLDMTPAGRQVGCMGPAEFKMPYELDGEEGCA